MRTHELFGKITATPSNTHFFNGAYRHRPSKTRYGNIGINDSPALGTHSEGTNRVANGSWNWFPDSRTAVEVKYLRLDQPDETVAVTDLGFLPTFDINNLAAMGNFFDPKLNARVGGASNRWSSQSYDRTEVKGSVSRFLDFAKAQHQIKAGFGWEDTTEDLTRLSNGWGTLSLVQSNTQIQARYYPVQPSQLSKSRTYTMFVQDDITITQRLVVNAGLLLTRDEFAQQLDSKNTFLKFGFGDEIQPRIGVNYNLRKGAGDKIYGSFGNYINLEQKSSARSLAPKNLFLNEALFDATTGRLISDTVLSNSTNKVIDPNVKPPYFNEFVLGYATPLMNHWSLDVFFMFRDGGNFIEDCGPDAAGQQLHLREPAGRRTPLSRADVRAQSSARQQVEPERELRAQQVLRQRRAGRHRLERHRPTTARSTTRRRSCRTARASSSKTRSARGRSIRIARTSSRRSARISRSSASRSAAACACRAARRTRRWGRTGMAATAASSNRPARAATIRGRTSICSRRIACR